VQHESRIGRHGGEPVDFSLHILEVFVAAAARKRLYQNCDGQRASDTPITEPLHRRILVAHPQRH
jgi:hypothetical protein